MKIAFIKSINGIFISPRHVVSFKEADTPNYSGNSKYDNLSKIVTTNGKEFYTEATVQEIATAVMEVK